MGWSVGEGALGAPPPTLAADLLLIMTDELSGVLRVHPRVAGFGLAGALLVELWMGGQVVVADGQLAVAARARLPDDGVLRVVVGWLLTEPQRSAVADWVPSLGVSALGWVTDALVDAGWVRAAARRRGGPRFEAVDRARVLWRGHRLPAVLAGSPSWPDVFALALLDAVGYAPRMLADAVAGPSRERIAALSVRLRQECAPVVEVASVVAALTARAALAPR